MEDNYRILGVDAGAVSLSVAEVNDGGEIVRTFYEFHHGQVQTCLDQILAQVDSGGIRAVAATSSTPGFIRADRRFDNQICLITTARRRHPECRSILVVGGERFGLVRLAADATYLSFKANPLCAAGTGGFLDQQARRLNLPGVPELAALALANHEPPPKIASRCAVFAKTDLAHAQQEGHSLEAICDGLCRGVATNIVDALFTGEDVLGPLLLVGGVARNQAVVRHLRSLLGLELVVDDQLAHGAVGAALKLFDERRSTSARSSEPIAARDIIDREPAKKACEFPPLELRLSDYPSFDSLERMVWTGKVVPHSHPLEIDHYRELAPHRRHDAYLGIDIGSTSTKAVVTSLDGSVIAGFYTATAGKPLVATQLILEAVSDWEKRKDIELSIKGSGTTGAGRKFVGKILGADLVLDEITAHARAAVELHPDVDTIIEIGGQDSKFTTLRNGRVTLSVMNNVCAAGTGSFIEEQARRLEVPLSEYGERTAGCGSPIASERCTVFMERDLNHYLNLGYSRGEVLAAVLHSVRENYLNKVAVESAIGKTIVFQGATARNRALIAAFEQRIGKPIRVSPYCHLTGALGVALTLRDENVRASTFRGLGLYRQCIPIRPETCDLCSNHCKLSIAEVEGETVAFGFLCGRDYGMQKRVANNTSGFDLFKERARAMPGSKRPRTGVTIGIPAALHLFEDVPFWKRFFHRLGIRTVTSERYQDAVKDGRHLAGAELCAPMTALHAHVAHLGSRCDAVFLPFYLEMNSHENGTRRQLCYYTQFAPSLGGGAFGVDGQPRIMRPIVHSLHGKVFAKAELYRVLRPLVPGGVSPFDISSAYDEAERAKEVGLARLREIYRSESTKRDGFHVVLLGRPYTVLSEWMNKGIPDTFASMGVPVFYQDMLSYGREDVQGIVPLLKEVHWHYAARILEAAEVTARTPGAYPVLLTSFKCSPDSFVTEYFRQVVESHGKPYLVLQLDEHDSRLGYETRVEAAVRAFRNHQRSASVPAAAPAPSPQPAVFCVPRGQVDLSGKTILFPDWDSLSLRLVVSSVRKTGRDARLLEPSEASMRRSLRHNSGQCTPLNIIAQDFIEYVERHDLDPARTVLWTAASNIACNVRLYPHHIRTILRSHGRGFDRAEVYTGAMTLLDISATLPNDVYLAYMFGGFIRRMGCKIRPAERHAGETDAVIEEGIRMLETVFEGRGSKEDALAALVSRFEAIETQDTGPRTKVAIFGDLYSRDNRVLNQDLIPFIEAHGGEVITTPYTSYVKMIVRPYYWKWMLEGQYMNVLSTGALMTGFRHIEKKYFRLFQRVLHETDPVYDSSPEAILSEYNVSVAHTGEAMDNLLKVFYIVRHHPDVALFVQASPAFCCPSLVTEAMAHEIERKTGVPMVSVTYDGTGGTKNEVILPYLEYPRAPRALQYERPA